MLTATIIIFIVYIVGVVALIRKSKKALDQEGYSRIKKPILVVASSGFGIICLISVCRGSITIPWLLYSYQNETISCLEMSIADDYKFIIEDNRDGEREVNFEEYDRNQRYIWSITKFAMVDEYLIGETSLLLYDRDFFWFNLNTKDFLDTRPEIELTTSEKEQVFLDSLAEIGIELPDMVSVETLCNQDECAPCNISP